MPELRSIGKVIADSVTFYPYKEIDEKDWPVYHLNGEWVKESPFWRKVGFRAPWPSPTRLKKLAKANSEVEFTGDGGAKIKAAEYAKFCKILTHQLIQGIVSEEDITFDGKPIDYGDPKVRDWLYQEFLKSDFLTSYFYESYNQLAGKLMKKDKEDKENFSDPLDTISSDSSKDTTSSSMETSDDSLPNLLEDE